MRITTFYDHITEMAEQESISLTEALQKVYGIGIEGVEVINMRKGSQNWVEMRSNLEKADIYVSALCYFFDFNAESAEAQIENALETAAVLSARHIMVVPGFYADGDSQREKEEKMKKSIRWMRILSHEAELQNISLIMEDFDDKNSLVATSVGLKKILEEIPSIGCAFDTGNFLYSEEDELEAFEELKERITYMHLKDRTFIEPVKGAKEKVTVSGRKMYASPVGQGVIHMKEILSRLREQGYDGPFAIEHYDAPNQWQYLKQSVAWLKEQMLEGFSFDSFKGAD